MRPAILCVLFFSMLEACSTSLAPTLPSRATSATANAHRAAFERATSVRTTTAAAIPIDVRANAVPAAAGSSTIDLGALAQIVARLPHDLYRFEIDLFVCAGAVVAIGIVNAFLIATLLATRRRSTAGTPPASDATAATAAMTASQERFPAAPVAAAIAEPVARTCACGAPIGARSKTGRCRQCALASRSKRPLREVTTATV